VSETLQHHVCAATSGERGICSRIVAAAVTLLIGLLFGPAVAAASVPPIPGGGEPVDEGSVVVTDPNGQPLAGGSGVALYSLDLPDGAACPGDSASKDWRVQGFMIPAGDDPGTIRYGVIGPEGTQFPLYAFDTRPYAHQLTQVSATPDAPGIIPRLPALTFGVFAPGDIPAGTYRIGVACTYFRQTARYWDTQIIIEDDPSESTTGIRFRVPDAPDGAVTAAAGGGLSRWFILAGVLGAAAVAVALWGARRARPKSEPLPTSNVPHLSTSTYDPHEPEALQ
jgi:hypothetical protein